MKKKKNIRRDQSRLGRDQATWQAKFVCSFGLTLFTHKMTQSLSTVVIIPVSHSSRAPHLAAVSVVTAVWLSRCPVGVLQNSRRSFPGPHSVSLAKPKPSIDTTSHPRHKVVHVLIGNFSETAIGPSAHIHSFIKGLGPPDFKHFKASVGPW